MQEITPITSMFCSTDDDVMSFIVHRIFIRYTSSAFQGLEPWSIYFMTITKECYGINNIPVFVTLHVKIKFPGKCSL